MLISWAHGANALFGLFARFLREVCWSACPCGGDDNPTIEQVVLPEFIEAHFGSLFAYVMVVWGFSVFRLHACSPQLQKCLRKRYIMVDPF